MLIAFLWGETTIQTIEGGTMSNAMRTALRRATETVYHFMPHGFSPKVGLVLGSGFSDFVRILTHKGSISYDQIAGFPTKENSVQGHPGFLHWGYLEGVPVMIMQGRLHFYEGYSSKEVTFPVRLLTTMECEHLILTHAVGGLREHYQPGDFVFSYDHLGFFCPNPFIGPNDEQQVGRFADMSEPYNTELIALAEQCARRLDITTYRGIAGFTTGPTYETSAEVRALCQLGADIATMSVVPEAIAVAHVNSKRRERKMDTVKMMAIAGVTNMGTGVLDKPLDHSEVTEMGQLMLPNFTRLLQAMIAQL